MRGEALKSPPADHPSSSAGTSHADPDLTALVEAWPTLPAELRAAVLRVVGVEPTGVRP